MMKKTNTTTVILILLALGGILDGIVLPVFASFTQGPDKPVRDVIALIIVLVGASCLGAAIFIRFHTLYKRYKIHRDNT